MTVIAAKIEETKIVMSCDSEMSRGWHRKSTGYPSKIIRGGDFIIGFAGIAAILPLLSMYSKNHPVVAGGEDRITEWCVEFLDFAKKKTGNFPTDKNSLILGHHSGLFCLESWLPLRVNDFCAIGSGTEYAEAAMYLGKNTEEAVDVAMHMGFGCGGSITTEKIQLS